MISTVTSDDSYEWRIVASDEDSCEPMITVTNYGDSCVQDNSDEWWWRLQVMVTIASEDNSYGWVWQLRIMMLFTSDSDSYERFSSLGPVLFLFLFLIKYVSEVCCS